MSFAHDRTGRRDAEIFDTSTISWPKARRTAAVGSMMPVMKYVMTLALFAAAMLAAPVGQADPDPHKPDLGAHLLPGWRDGRHDVPSRAVVRWRAL